MSLEIPKLWSSFVLKKKLPFKTNLSAFSPLMTIQ